MADDHAIGPCQQNEDERRYEGKAYPETDEFPVECAGVQKDIHQFNGSKRGHEGHDHIEQEDDSCAHILRYEFSRVSV